MALIIGIVAVLIIIFGFLCYKKAPPTEAIAMLLLKAISWQYRQNTWRNIRKQLET